MRLFNSKDLLFGDQEVFVAYILARKISAKYVTVKLSDWYLTPAVYSKDPMAIDVLGVYIGCHRVF
jgi:hypothetical protein